ncbi:PilW family protein [Neiella sp. HB171785]|uniref:PilW family protein n=1 Tax=Neiella litorisoli TaxID=2771431 RepID=A0A8J6QI12_9GAMM|nr:PilW family protein [Neiella litorisoli]MBD1388887.1 PilW family protein [Neiella litorisoli]
MTAACSSVLAKKTGLHPNAQAGLSMVELIIAMLLGLMLLMGAMSVLSNNNANLQLNEGLASVQENGRFALTRLTQTIRLAGSYNPQDPALNLTGVDPTTEQADLAENAVVFPGVYASGLAVGSVNGASGASDTLVVGLQAEADCRLNTHGYGTTVVAGGSVAQQFHVINEYYLEDDSLKCRGYEGRVLRGEKASSANTSAVTLVENVEDFQVLYGVAEADGNNVFSGQPSSYMTADRAATAVTNGGRVVAVQFALLIYSDEPISSTSGSRSVKLLDKTAFTPTERRIYRQFQQTVMLRNPWNSAVFEGTSS